MKAKYVIDKAEEASINWGSHSDPNDILEFGKEYEIERAEVHSWHTKIFLKDFPDKSFNSCWFTWSKANDIWELPGAKESWEGR